MLDLAWLIQPFPTDAFLADVWQKEPRILSCGHALRLDGLFGFAALERAIEFGQPQPPTLRLACNTPGAQKAEVPYTAGRIDIDKLRKLYLTGQTVILNSVQDFDPAIADLTRRLQNELHARVQTNCYCTPPTSQGFAPHYDTHDVLVLQVEGEKRWKVYGADSACPLQELRDGDPKLRPSARAPDTFVLRAGDVLYIPRGYIHEAEAEGVASLHLTFGIHPPLNKDLLIAAIEQLTTTHPMLREALPIGPLAGSARKAAVRSRLAGLIALLDEAADADSAALILDEQILRLGRSGGDGRLFSDIDVIRTISPDLMLERRDNVTARIVPHDGGVALQMLSGSIVAPDRFAPAMNYVAASRGPFPLSALPQLEPVEQQVFGASLVSDGLCRVVAAVHID